MKEIRNCFTCRYRDGSSWSICHECSLGYSEWEKEIVMRNCLSCKYRDDFDESLERCIRCDGTASNWEWDEVERRKDEENQKMSRYDNE
jgi:hypothetical protein